MFLKAFEIKADIEIVLCNDCY